MGRLLLALAVALCGVPAAGHSAATMRGANTVSGKPASTYPGRPARQATGFETLFYLRNNDQAIRSFADNAQHISIIGPQTFNISAAGELRGRVDPRILEIARANGVSVMPLFLNPGFDQQIVHQLLDDPAARDRAVLALVDLAVAHDFWGWQFDLENIHQSYRDRLTDFYRQAAEALHAAGKTISIAVVPTDGSAGSDPFSTYMQENWRNSFDVAALAEIGDFVSWMTYAQHAGGTTPGPVAGLPWMREMMDAVLAQGVAPEKILLRLLAAHPQRSVRCARARPRHLVHPRQRARRRCRGGVGLVPRTGRPLHLLAAQRHLRLDLPRRRPLVRAQAGSPRRVPGPARDLGMGLGVRRSGDLGGSGGAPLITRALTLLTAASEPPSGSEKVVDARRAPRGIPKSY